MPNCRICGYPVNDDTEGANSKCDECRGVPTDRCDACCEPEHARCSLTDGCPCCEDTLAHSRNRALSMAGVL